jgi:hypothetical protein
MYVDFTVTMDEPSLELLDADELSSVPESVISTNEHQDVPATPPIIEIDSDIPIQNRENESLAAGDLEAIAFTPAPTVSAADETTTALFIQWAQR